MMRTEHAHPILDCVAALAWERHLLKNETEEWQAMSTAARGVAEGVTQDFREIGGLQPTSRLLILAGKGNNAGDALLAARDLLVLHPAACAEVVFAYGEDTLRPLARRAWAALREAGGARVTVLAAVDISRDVSGWDMCLDGLFGFQFRPPLDARVAQLLADVNAHPAIRLRAAVDLPSGLSDGAGKPDGVFRADFTYATGIVKSPMVTAQNAAVTGRLRYLDLGFFAQSEPAEAGALRVLTLGLITPLAQLRPAQSDKRTFGHLLVVGGSLSYPGAVVMTVQAALRAGTGLVTAVVPAPLATEFATRLPEAMWVGAPVNTAGGLSSAAWDLVRTKAERVDAVVLGPGLGAEPDTLALARTIAAEIRLPLVVDADALRAEILAVAGPQVVATPHAGERQRIADWRGWEGESVLVLKGSPTRICGGGTVAHSFFGGPVLARGGSGDLLAGLLGGLLAQKPQDLWLAACRAVVWHGRAADLLARDRGQVAVQTSQILDYLQPALTFPAHESR